MILRFRHVNFQFKVIQVGIVLTLFVHSCQFEPLEEQEQVIQQNAVRCFCRENNRDHKNSHLCITKLTEPTENNLNQKCKEC